MHCKACDRPIAASQQLFYQPLGHDQLVMETLCTACLATIRRAPRPSWDESDDEFALILGTRHVEVAETE